MNQGMLCSIVTMGRNEQNCVKELNIEFRAMQTQRDVDSTRIYKRWNGVSHVAQNH